MSSALALSLDPPLDPSARATTASPEADAISTTAPAAVPSPSPDSATPRLRLVTGSGASAELDPSHGGELLRVRDPEGAVLFEYDARAGTGTLRMPRNLRLEALQGSIELVAAEGVRCVAGGEVALRSATAASVTVGGADGETSGLRVSPQRAALASDELQIRAKQAEIHFDRARYLGDALHAAVSRAEIVAAEIETRADTLIESAGNVFRRVKELHQLNAGRLRTLVEGALRLEGGHVVLLAKDDVRIDGEHIELG